MPGFIEELRIGFKNDSRGTTALQRSTIHEAKNQEERCKGWLHGSLKKKDDQGQKKFTSIVDRYQKDPDFVIAVNEEMQK